MVELLAEATHLTRREQVEVLTQVSLSPPQPQSDALVAAPYGGTVGGITSSALQVRVSNFSPSLHAAATPRTPLISNSRRSVSPLCMLSQP